MLPKIPIFAKDQLDNWWGYLFLIGDTQSPKCSLNRHGRDLRFPYYFHSRKPWGTTIEMKINWGGWKTNSHSNIRKLGFEKVNVNLRIENKKDEDVTNFVSCLI